MNNNKTILIDGVRYHTWHDGRVWNIDRVIHSCASLDGEYEGIRYTVYIGSAEKYIYRAGHAWYVMA